MADGKQIDKLQRDAQQASSPEEAASAQIEGRLKDLHTCLPGIIMSFDPAKQTCVAQPAIQRIFTEKGTVNLPVCVDVPVQFPGGGDFFLTFPVKAGDECMLHFSERAIDNWYASGGAQAPAEYRLHDLSDAMATVGINSQPKKIPSYNPTDVELRNREGTTHVQMKPDGTITNLNPVGNTILSAAGKFTINCPGGFEVNGPTAQINVPQTTITGTTTIQNGLAVSGDNGTGKATTIAGSINHTSGTITSLGKKIDGTHTHNETGTVTNPPNA
jgi:hypothetical protein